MNFFTWERDHAQPYVEMVDNGDISNMPAFQESSKSDVSSMIGNIIEQRLTDGKSLVETIPIICEYLYETYHISPADVEVLSQYVILGVVKLVVDSAKRVGEEVGKMMLQGEDETHEDR